MENSKYQNVNKYIERVSDGKSDKFITGIASTLNKAEKYAESIDKPLTEFTKQDFIGLFNKYNWAKIRGSFDTNRNRIAVYIKFLFREEEKQGVIDSNRENVLDNLANLSVQELDEESIRQKYFSSEDEFLQFVDDLGEEFVIEKMILLLSWAGFTSKEIGSLRRDSVNQQKSMIGMIPCSDKLIEQVLRVRSIDYYFIVAANNATRRFDLEDSDYLVRRPVARIRIDNESATTSTKAIECRISKLNKYNIKHGEHPVYLSCLSLNRKFCDDYEFEKKTKNQFKYTPGSYVISKKSNPLERVDMNGAITYVYQYNQWKRVFGL